MPQHSDIDIARVHDKAPDRGRARRLVDRIWPRGVSKATLRHDDWIRDIAPTTALRAWFGHDPQKWGASCNRSPHELANNADAVGRGLAWCRARSVSLLCAAKNREHNQAVVLRDDLQQRLKENTS
ncbi:DUF488 domain-containing protein [Ponticoccus alexandrii]|uniref:DUF488 family protein n=1 Tax=Ponticoccus alexandrii TaxID=1943633 RepID=A0ABX7F7U8_9RHOB|nr:DUF488 family protein [Ponticoccus alexandrii]ETA50154.1 hypothetical protein P279_21100 [Rhodobacteraceae bacterium PD-2]QRF65768.1 DUF488 family protein [Ponticoccus alexandrii]